MAKKGRFYGGFAAGAGKNEEKEEKSEEARQAGSRKIDAKDTAQWLIAIILVAYMAYMTLKLHYII